MNHSTWTKRVKSVEDHSRFDFACGNGKLWHADWLSKPSAGKIAIQRNSASISLVLVNQSIRITGPQEDDFVVLDQIWPTRQSLSQLLKPPDSNSILAVQTGDHKSPDTTGTKMHRMHLSSFCRFPNHLPLSTGIR